MTLPFIYQLQNATYSSLASEAFRLAVVDMDDTGMDATQVASLTKDQGKLVLTYLSIGEAEDYRDYWQDGDWNHSPPDFLLGENPDWEGNYSVEFWDEDWQQIMFSRVDEAIELGYSGIYLDIVDAYTVGRVRNAHSGSEAEIRQEMIDFVIALSEHAKAQKDDFMVVPQNALGLLAQRENNPDGSSNKAYLDAVDGLGVEDLWYDGNRSSGWTNGDLEFIAHALAADKFVLATSYPTNNSKQESFVANAIGAGLIPFVADRNLTGVIDSINNGIEARMEGRDVEVPWDGSAPGDSGGGGGDGPGPVETGVTLTGNGRANILVGTSGDDKLLGKRGSDLLDGRAGDDILKAGGGNDRVIGGEGSDMARGGRGKDVFVFKVEPGEDRVRDFVKGDDKLDFSEINGAGFSALDTSGDGRLSRADSDVAVRNGHTIIDLAGAWGGEVGTSTVTVHGVTSMTADDFIF